MAVLSTSLDRSEVYPGRILWLPSRRHLPVSHSILRVPSGAPIDARAYGHPVVICSIPTGSEISGLVHFHVITSFGNQTLEERFSDGFDDWRHQHTYLPIEPARYHPENLRDPNILGCPRIRISNDLKMVRDSYINANEEYEADWHIFDRYETRYNLPQVPLRLDSKSVRKMHNRCRSLAAMPEVQPPRPDSGIGGVSPSLADFSDDSSTEGSHSDPESSVVVEIPEDDIYGPVSGLQPRQPLGFSGVISYYESVPSSDRDALPLPVQATRKAEKRSVRDIISAIAAWLLALGLLCRRMLGRVWAVIRRFGRKKA